MCGWRPKISIHVACIIDRSKPGGAPPLNWNSPPPNKVSFQLKQGGHTISFDFFRVLFPAYKSEFIQNPSVDGVGLEWSIDDLSQMTFKTLHEVVATEFDLIFGTDWWNVPISHWFFEAEPATEPAQFLAAEDVSGKHPASVGSVLSSERFTESRGTDSDSSIKKQASSLFSRDRRQPERSQNSPGIPNPTPHTQQISAMGNPNDRQASTKPRLKLLTDVTAAVAVEPLPVPRPVTPYTCVTEEDTSPHEASNFKFSDSSPETASREFREDPAHQFWTWSREKEMWFHTEPTGEAIWCPRQMD
jgi:hypothetical protein